MRGLFRSPLLGVLAVSALTGCAPPLTGQGGVTFDDFTYRSVQDPAFRAAGWRVRNADATSTQYRPAQVTFPADGDGRVMRLTATTDGTPAGTHQAQVFGPVKHQAGTYAARVRFANAPLTGPDGDKTVQAFFPISDPTTTLGTRYSELDFEYVANGGWGNYTYPVMHLTSWAGYDGRGLRDVVNTPVKGELSGWQVLTATVQGDDTTLALGSRVLARYRTPYTPDSALRLAFSNRFIPQGLLPPGEARTYVMDVDWVLHVPDVALSPEDVTALVHALRAPGAP